jgi:quercetin dioxygenase-like cupin family protein
MEMWSLTALADGLLSHAVRASSGRSMRTVHGAPPHVLRQSVIALVAGQTLGQCDGPGDGTVHVLRGRVRVAAGDDTTDGSAGQLLIVPDGGHTVQALEDAVVLLTVAERAAPRAPSLGHRHRPLRVGGTAAAVVDPRTHY